MSKGATSSSSSSRNPKDGSASGGFLSKASNSIRRSPSKKHKSRSSNPLPSLDQIFYETQKSQPSEHHPSPQKRPDVYRNKTAPPVTHTVKSAGEESKTAESALQANTVVTSGTSNHKGDTPSSLNKATVAMPQNGEYVQYAAADASFLAPASVAGSQNPITLYQYIHDMANKRISTLDYFRKAYVNDPQESVQHHMHFVLIVSSHEGRVFWFNTVHFSRPDLSRLPNFSSTKLARRATNYLLLGLSIPPVLEVHPQNHSASSAAANAAAAYDFLKILNALLGEFETYQQNHPPDGGTASTLSRARIPHMFKRATQVTSSRSRRTSSIGGPEIGLPLQQNPSSHTSDSQRHHHHHHHHGSHSSTSPSSSDHNMAILNPNSSSMGLSITAPSQHPTSTSTPTTSLPTCSSSLFPASVDLPNSTISPNEGPYTYLLTPPIPFSPDFYTVFATLCDLLVDAYQRILTLVNSPVVCAHGSHQGLGEMFAKADARLRKVIVGAVAREFEAAARDGSKREILGVQRVVLGGLFGG